MSAALLPPDLADRDNGQQPYPRRQTAPVCERCHAPLDEAQHCPTCSGLVCPDCGCCRCLCFEVEP